MLTAGQTPWWHSSRHGSQPLIMAQLWSWTTVLSPRIPDQSATAAAAADALRALVANLDGVESYVCGSDVGLSPASYDFAVVGVFATHAELPRSS